MTKKIRLSEETIDMIIEVFNATFGNNGRLWIFGSRVDIDARGGDIDLYVETELDIDNAVAMQNKIHTSLYYALGERKIDIVLNIINLQEHVDLEIYKVAKETGVRLV